MLKICIIEACEKKDKGSIGAFYIRYHAQLAGYNIDVLDETKDGYDVELLSVHHCSNFEQLAKMPKRAKWRIIGGHPMQNNPLPCIPYADVIGIGEGETWIKNVLRILDEERDIRKLSKLSGTIICENWIVGNEIPKPNIEDPLPDNPPYLNYAGTKSAAWYIEFARGCPFSCDYCELGHSIPYRAYDIEHLKKVIDKADINITRKINPFAPDEASVKRYNELYDYINQKGFSAGFASMRIDSVLNNMPNLKHNHLIRVGIDGLTEETRFKVGKKISNQMIYDYFKTYIERGHINFKIFMIVGYPWDTIKDFDEFDLLISRIKNLPFKKNVSLRIKWTPLIPQPCTPLAKVKPNYTFEIYQKIMKWHEINRNPITNIGLHIENDGLMSILSHKKQCELTSGDEFTLVKKYKPLHMPKCL